MSGLRAAQNVRMREQERTRCSACTNALSDRASMHVSKMRERASSAVYLCRHLFHARPHPYTAPQRAACFASQCTPVPSICARCSRDFSRARTSARAETCSHAHLHDPLHAQMARKKRAAGRSRASKHGCAADAPCNELRRNKVMCYTFRLSVAQHAA